MTCRSSFRSGPGWFVGMNGSITAHCSSESQNRSAIAASMLQTASQNHKTIALATPWFGSHPSFVHKAKAELYVRQTLVVSDLFHPRSKL